MNQTNIVCPHCGYNKDVDKEKIPARVKSVTCPSCERSFSFDALKNPDSLQNAPQDRTEPRHLHFVFTGNAREYFGIWIVNTLLKIVTLGLYSPWAKVRKRQYFYGNTLLDDANFDYLANPLALLKGWLIGAALFITYSLGSRYSPVAGMIFGLLIFLLIPWVIVRSRLFNNRNSAHRNIRFNFRPAYGESYKIHVGLPILSVFTLGILTPYVYYRQKRFLMENSSFGRSSFGFDARAGDFYMVAFKTFGFVLLGIAVFGGGAALLTAVMPGIDPQAPVFAGALMPLMMAGYFCIYFFIFIYSYVRIANLTWNGTHLGGSRFISTLRVRDMTWILLSNTLAAILSIGLLIPWASVRLARYRLENLALLAAGNLDHFRNAPVGETSAAGEEIGDIFGVDFGF